MSRPLAKVFTDVLPRLLAEKGTPEAGSVVFISGSGPERGRWLVDLTRGEVRVALPDEQGSATVEAEAEILTLFFAGALDLQVALRRGAMVVHGDLSRLESLAAAAAPRS